MRDASYGQIRKASVAALPWRGTEPGLSVLETQKHQLLWHELGAAFAGRGCSRSHPPWRCTVVGRTSDTLTHGLCPFFWLAPSSSNPFCVKTPPEDHSPPRKVLSQATAAVALRLSKHTVVCSVTAPLPWTWLKTQHHLRAAFPRLAFAFLSSLDEQNETVTKSITALVITSPMSEKRIITQSVLRVRI